MGFVINENFERMVIDRNIGPDGVVFIYHSSFYLQSARAMSLRLRASIEGIISLVHARLSPNMAASLDGDYHLPCDHSCVGWRRMGPEEQRPSADNCLTADATAQQRACQNLIRHGNRCAANHSSFAVAICAEVITLARPRINTIAAIQSSVCVRDSASNDIQSTATIRPPAQWQLIR
jgi:hypothetical protein